ncbi:MAG: hypothetical protein PVJ92_01855 [Candidatus Dependentiae bacterium]|jgi:hypothetical protein
MKSLKKLWSYLTRPGEDRPYVLGIFVARPSDTMTHYIERLVASLRMLYVRPLEVVIFENVHQRSRQAELLEHIAATCPDLFLTMDSDSSNVLIRFTQEEGIMVPGFLLGYEDLVSREYPDSLMGIFPPVDWERNYILLRQAYPKLKSFLLCGGHAMLDRHGAFVAMRERAARDDVAVHHIYVDGADSLKRQFDHYSGRVEMALFAFDPILFPFTRELVSLAREHNLFSVSSNLYAIYEGVDIAIGYPEAKVLDFIAHKIISFLQQQQLSHTSIFRFDFELHCNVKNLQHSTYILQNIGRLFLEDELVSVHIHADENARR